MKMRKREKDNGLHNEDVIYLFILENICAMFFRKV
jgi:hypothetical protein